MTNNLRAARFFMYNLTIRPSRFQNLTRIAADLTHKGVSAGGKMKPQSLSRWPFVILILVMAALACTCGLPFSLGGTPDQPGDEPPIVPGLNLDPRGADGLVSGAFLNADGKVTRFSVSADGQATYRLDGAPESQELAISLPSSESASLTWAGIAMDGYGEKDSDQLSLLDNLMNSDMAYALVMTPLDLACQGEDQIDPQQLAALLFPLQMYFKYQLTNRSAISQALVNGSQCNYGINPQSQLPSANLLYLTPADPVPVVFGFFPFDAEGAVEQPATSHSQFDLASMHTNYPIYSDSTVIGSILQRTVPNENAPIINQWGACEAMCRGACGRDCTSNNCSMDTGPFCEKDAQGDNTGMLEQVRIYKCGLHPACIKHDACYDACNAYWGCHTWDAAYCRHGGWTGMENPGKYLTEKAIEIARGYSLCDIETVAEQRFIDVVRWMEGYGPQPIQQVFIYTEETDQKTYDPAACPLTLDPEEEAPADQNTQVEVPEQEQTSEAYIGEVFIATDPQNLSDLAVSKSQVDLIVTGETVSAEVSFSYNFYLYIQDQNNPAENCMGFFEFAFSGEGPLTNPLSLQMAQTHFSFSKQGPSCDKSTSDPGVGVNSTILSGSFNADGSFSGSLDPDQYVFRFFGVSAGRVEK